VSDERGKARDFLTTWSDITFRPRTFFSEPASGRSRWSAVRFALVIAVASTFSAVVFDILIKTKPLAEAAPVGLAMLVISPLLTFVSLYISAGLTHLFLRLIRGRHKPFAETFHCFCYAYAPALFGVIPVVGGLVGGIWGLVVVSIGMKRVHATTTGRAVFSILAVPVSWILLALTLRMFVLEAFKIPSGAMIPTIQVGDHIFVNKLTYRFSEPRRGEVIVFIYPKERDKDFIKRVVAVGGDTVEMRDNVLYVNDQPVPRTHVDGDCQYDDYDETSARWERRSCDAWKETAGESSYTTVFDRNGAVHSTKPVQVPPKSVFVMGDNRDNSFDSRFWGTVPYDLIKGKAMFVWWSSGENGSPRLERIWQSVQ
jgi:signal peptidase I